MSLIANFEAEIKAFIIKVLEELGLYNPPPPPPPPPPPSTDTQ